VWLEGAHRTFPGNNAGPMNLSGASRILLHSTEGGSIDGAVSAYIKNNSWPTFTVDIFRRVIQEHLPMEVGARSLRNLSEDPGPTNTEGDYLVQIEIVGFAENPDSQADVEGWKWFGRNVIGPVARAIGAPLTSTVRWVPYPASYGYGQGQRLEDAAFKSYQGVFGHEHADENVHGDPGAIPIQTILDASEGELDMDYNDVVKACKDAMEQHLIQNKVSGDDALNDELCGWTHWQTYFTYTSGAMRPVIASTEADPNSWYVWSTFFRAGPFTGPEADSLVQCDAAAYHPDTNDLWRAYRIPEIAMKMSKLVYEHLPLPG